MVVLLVHVNDAAKKNYFPLPHIVLDDMRQGKPWDIPNRGFWNSK